MTVFSQIRKGRFFQGTFITQGRAKRIVDLSIGSSSSDGITIFESRLARISSLGQFVRAKIDHLNRAAIRFSLAGFRRAVGKFSVLMKQIKHMRKSNSRKLSIYDHQSKTSISRQSTIRSKRKAQTNVYSYQKLPIIA